MPVMLMFISATKMMLNTPIPSDEMMPATTKSLFLPSPRATWVMTSKNDIAISSKKQYHT